MAVLLSADFGGFLNVANFGRLEVEDYSSVVEMQSEHLTHQATDDLAQSLPIRLSLLSRRFHLPLPAPVAEGYLSS